MLGFFLFCLFSYQKKCFLTWQTSVQVVFFVERVRKPMYYSFQPILRLILTDLNRGLGCFQLFLSGWVYSFNAIAVTFIITLLFFFFWNTQHCGVTGLVTSVCWLDAEAAGQKGNVIHLRKLPCSSAGLFFHLVVQQNKKKNILQCNLK